MLGKRQLCASLVALAFGFVPGVGAHAQERAAAVGLYNWVHTTGDAERAFAFYRDVLGIELAPSPFAPGAAAPEGIRPVAAAGSDELVWRLTNTRGSRFRTVFMRAPNTRFGLELSEFFDIERNERPPNPWDPGSSRLVFAVRDLPAVVARLATARAPVVTIGGAPVATSEGLAVLARDPDGYLVEVRQASPELLARAAPGDIVETALGITVASLEGARRFYGDLLGLDITAPRQATAAELALEGVREGELRVAATTIPKAGARVTFAEYRLPATAGVRAAPYRWRIQDIGAPQFQLEVTQLDSLLQRTRRAGYEFLSVNGEPIQRAFGRFVFAIDGDGVLVEYVEPTRR